MECKPCQRKVALWTAMLWQNMQKQAGFCMCTIDTGSSKSQKLSSGDYSEFAAMPPKEKIIWICQKHTDNVLTCQIQVSDKIWKKMREREEK